MILKIICLSAAAVLVVIISRFVTRKREETVCRIGGFRWTKATFSRHFLITGATGAGKSSSGLRRILFEVFTNQNHFGGLFVDDKGTLHEWLEGMAIHFGRRADLILLKLPPQGELPQHRFNLIGDRSIPSQTYARALVDTASAMGQRREQSFFKQAAQIHLAHGIDALVACGYEVSLENLYHLLTDAEDLSQVIDELEQEIATRPLASHFQKFLGQPPEQLEGIRGTIQNYLGGFVTSRIAEVFCRDSTFQLRELDRGKIICVALPQSFQVERRYVGTFLKQLFYLHVLQRFDLVAAERDKLNLLLLVADEAQHFLTFSEEGLSDHRMVDVMREAGAAMIAATQSTTSLIPVLGSDAAKVLTLNLRNRMIFTAADEDDARHSAEFLGKRYTREETVTRGPDGKRSISRSLRERYRVEPDYLRSLRPHKCLLVCADKGFRRTLLTPIEPDGKTSPWYG